MKVMFINNDGGGFCDSIEVRDGITVEQFFAERMPGREPRDYLIRLDRLPVTADQALTPGCRVSITPTKIEGAERAAAAA